MATQFQFWVQCRWSHDADDDDDDDDDAADDDDDGDYDGNGDDGLLLFLWSVKLLL